MREPLEVVVVEDDVEVAAVLELLFELHERFQVVAVVGDGSAAGPVVARFRPDAVVLDLHLPGVQGTELIDLVRRASPSSAVVVFSAFPDPFTLVDVLRAGADSYLDKATAWMDLLPTLLEVCELRRSRSDAP